MHKRSKEPITNTRDYNSFLINGIRETYNNALSEKVFWSNRLRPDSSGIGDLGPLAGAYTNLFEVTGNVNYLKNVEQLYKKAIKLSFQNKDIYIRSLAHNYISQHRFKEARNILEESYAGISNKHLTELMLFDVYMELGDYLKADEFLGKIKNNNDYNYLIRLAKWSEYKGNLEAAIRYLEKAKKIAESRGSKSLKIWAYINLADFYGHAGKLKKAYNHYLMTLNLQPDNAYAKKGIAWIAFSSEKNTDEAKRILDSIMIHHKVPDYFLFKADIAEYENKILDMQELIRTHLKKMIENEKLIIGQVINVEEHLKKPLNINTPETSRINKFTNALRYIIQKEFIDEDNGRLELTANGQDWALNEKENINDKILMTDEVRFNHFTIPPNATDKIKKLLNERML